MNAQMMMNDLYTELLRTPEAIIFKMKSEREELLRNSDYYLKTNNMTPDDFYIIESELTVINDRLNELKYNSNSGYSQRDNYGRIDRPRAPGYGQQSHGYGIGASRPVGPHDSRNIGYDVGNANNQQTGYPSRVNPSLSGSLSRDYAIQSHNGDNMKSNGGGLKRDYTISMDNRYKDYTIDKPTEITTRQSKPLNQPTGKQEFLLNNNLDNVNGDVIGVVGSSGYKLEWVTTYKMNPFIENWDSSNADGKIIAYLCKHKPLVIPEQIDSKKCYGKKFTEIDFSNIKDANNIPIEEPGLLEALLYNELRETLNNILLANGMKIITYDICDYKEALGLEKYDSGIRDYIGALYDTIKFNKIEEELHVDTKGVDIFTVFYAINWNKANQLWLTEKSEPTLFNIVKDSGAIHGTLNILFNTFKFYKAEDKYLLVRQL